MTYSSCLIDDPRPLVLDTSVLINLHACTYGERILMAIPNDIIVAQIVAKELQHETSLRNGEHSFLRGLISQRKVSLVEMSEEEYELFANLTSGGSSLDDGEAATLAIAAKRDYLPIVDEKRGRARALTLAPLKKAGWSLDVLLHPQVQMSLSAVESVESVYLALRDARMRIADGQCEFVVGLIGSQRALECRSLPGYKHRCLKWQEG